MKLRTFLFGLLIAILGIVAYSQTTWNGIRWHWWTCGLDKISPRQYIVTYTTGKEIIVCNEIYSSFSQDGFVHGYGNSAAVSCVQVKRGE
jgi:hypothetical protein